MYTSGQDARWEVVIGELVLRPMEGHMCAGIQILMGGDL
jgi:hypothetical protein